GREVLGIYAGMGRGDSDMALFLKIQLAGAHAREGRPAEALETLERLLREVRASHGDDYPVTFFHSAFARIRLRMGNLRAAREEAGLAAASAANASGEESCPAA